jgi:hypothetical protein
MLKPSKIPWVVIIPHNPFLFLIISSLFKSFLPLLVTQEKSLLNSSLIFIIDLITSHDASPDSDPFLQTVLYWLHLDLIKISFFHWKMIYHFSYLIVFNHGYCSKHIIVSWTKVTCITSLIDLVVSLNLSLLFNKTCQSSLSWNIFHVGYCCGSPLFFCSCIDHSCLLELFSLYFLAIL